MVAAALGATPVHAAFAQVGPLAVRHEVDGQETGFFAPPHAWITANVTLSADALTVVANERRYAKLSAAQRRILRTAAARAAQRAAVTMAADSDAKLAPGYCRAGRVVVASRANVGALKQATRPVYAQLERDPQVKATIAAIRELQSRTPADPAPKMPANCSRLASSTNADKRDPRFLDGTYRWRITRAGALGVGGSAADPAIGTTASMTLRAGGWLLEVSNGSRDSGTFTLIGNRIAFTWPRQGYTDSFAFKRRDDGTLDLTPVLPMDVGDRVVWSSAPWTRVGPPVRKVP